MERDSTLGEHTRALLAEHGIQVTEEGVRRARAKIQEADARTTPAAWQELRDFVATTAL